MKRSIFQQIMAVTVKGETRMCKHKKKIFLWERGSLLGKRPQEEKWDNPQNKKQVQTRHNEQCSGQKL